MREINMFCIITKKNIYIDIIENDFYLWKLLFWWELRENSKKNIHS